MDAGDAKLLAKFSKDALRDLILLPPDDVSVETCEDWRRVEGESVPEGAPAFIRETVLMHSGKYKKVVRKSVGYEKTDKDMGKNMVYQVDVPDDAATTAKEIVRLEHMKVDPINKDPQKKLYDRRDLLRCFEPGYVWNSAERFMCHRVGPRALASTRKRVLIDPRAIAFDTFTTVEPLFVTITLHDVASKRRVSETFTCHLNNAVDMSDFFRKNQSEVERYLRFDAAVVDMPPVSEDVYMVVVVRRVLLGDDILADAYEKKKAASERDCSQLRNKVATLCERMREYSQVFAWGAVPLFGSDGTLSVPDGGRIPLYKVKQGFSDTQLYDMIGAMGADAKRSTALKKTLLPNASFTVLVQSLPSDALLAGAHTSSLQPVRLPTSATPFTMQPSFRGDAMRLVRELEAFPAQPSLLPRTEMVNLLYVYPESVNFGARNIVCRIEVLDEDDPNGPRLPLVCRSGFSETLATFAHTSTTYHCKTPSFDDEIKIVLPTVMHRHHVLFSFYHVGVNPKKPLRQPLGQVFYQPFRDNVLVREEVCEKRVVSHLPKNYFFGSDERFDLVDGGKALFRFRTKVVSNVYPGDAKLHAFYDTYPESATEPAEDIRVEAALSGLTSAPPASVLPFFPAIFNQLFRTMAVRSDDLAAKAFFVLVKLVAKVAAQRGNRDRNPNLVQYALHTFDNVPGSVPLYERILPVLHKLYTANEPSKQDINITPSRDELRNATVFLFDVLVKSLGVHGVSTVAVAGEKRMELGAKVFKYLRDIVKAIGEDTSVKPDKVLSRSLALFFSDLFALVDRKQVFALINDYLTTAGRDRPDVVMVRIEFFAVLADHEHFVPLCAAHVMLARWHFLANALVDEVLSALQCGNDAVATKAVQMLRNAMVKHDHDARYAKDKKRLERVVGMYMPLVQTVAELFSQGKLKGLKGANKRDLYVCVMMVCKHIRTRMRAVWKKAKPEHRTALLDIMLDALSVFQYTPAAIKRNEAEKKMGNVPVILGPSMVQRIRKSQDEDVCRDISQSEANLCNEVYCVVLDVVCDYVKDFDREFNATTAKEVHPALMQLSNILTRMMSLPLSDSFLVSLAAVVRAFLYTYRRLYFSLPVDFVMQTCAHIVRFCDCPSASSRGVASALLLFLTKLNLEERKNATRVEVSLSSALHEYLESLDKKANTELLSRSMNAIPKYVPKGSPSLLTKVATTIRDKMHKIILDMRELHAALGDVAFKAERFYALGINYITVPALRGTWMQRLADLHEADENWLEAGYALLHLAYVQAEMLGEDLGIDRAFFLSEFTKLCPHIKPTPQLPEDTVWSSWTPQTLRDTLEHAVSMFRKGRLHPLAVEVYGLYLLVVRNQRDYTSLAATHRSIAAEYDTMIAANEDQRVALSEYYRIGFFGTKFGNMNGKEYIYRENFATRLADMKFRLEGLCAQKFAKEEIHVITGSKAVDTSKHVKDHVYIQITFVTPFLEDGNHSESDDYYAKHTNLTKFMFETPYTTTGKMQGSTAEQCKRKTILVVERGFPDDQKRHEVIRHDQILLSPIENSLEAITERFHKLRSELKSPAPDMRSIQQVLQGSVAPTVNQGPLEICKTFLTDACPADVAAAHKDKLRSAMVQFLQVCKDALQTNKVMVMMEANEEARNSLMQFHEQLELGYKNLTTNMAELGIYAARPQLKSLVMDDIDDEVDDLTSKTPRRASTSGMSPVTSAGKSHSPLLQRPTRPRSTTPTSLLRRPSKPT